MSAIMRVLCVVGSILTFAFFFFKVRKEQMRIGDTIFWLAFSLGLVVLGIFPEILVKAADLLGIASPVNGLFLGVLFIVLIKLFSQTVRISELNRKLERLTQEMALAQSGNAVGADIIRPKHQDVALAQVENDGEKAGDE